MKWIIAGSRTFNDKEFIKQFFAECINKYGEPDEVISGGAKGVDAFAKSWARYNKYFFMEFPANWDKYGPAAGPIRNKEMASYAGKDAILVLVWDGKSKGSLSMKNEAIKAGIQVVEYVYKN